MGSRDAIIFSVSHCWETREHPDPCCFQLGQLVDCISLYDLAYHSDIWVFLDYTSLYQFLRTEEQEKCYQLSMRNIHVMYAHACTVTLRMEGLTPGDLWKAVEDSARRVPVYNKPSGVVEDLPLRNLLHNREAQYHGRGWCKAETEWSAARGSSQQNQQIDGMGGNPYSNHRSVWGGRVTMDPELFEKQMDAAAFTHRYDAPQVIALQAKIFHEKVTMAYEVTLEDLPESEVEHLISALPHYKDW